MSNLQDSEVGLDKVKKLNQIAQMVVLFDSLPVIEKMLQEAAKEDTEFLEKLCCPPRSAVHFYELNFIDHSIITTILGVCVNDLMDETTHSKAIKQAIKEEDIELPEWLNLDDDENLPAIMFGGYYTLCRSIKAVHAVGRPISQLLEEGSANKDISLLKLAVKFDPMTISSPQILSRLMADEVIGKKDTRQVLYNALKNPHKIEYVAHAELRYVVWALHEEGLLQEMSEEERYQFLCERLGFYPGKSEERFDSLHRLIRRWQEDFRT